MCGCPSTLTMKNTDLQTETSRSRGVDEKGFEAETGLSHDRKYSVYFGSCVTKEMSIMYVPVNVQEVANLIQVSESSQKANVHAMQTWLSANEAVKWISNSEHLWHVLYMTEVILPAACSQSEHKKQLFVIMQQRQTERLWKAFQLSSVYPRFYKICTQKYLA